MIRGSTSYRAVARQEQLGPLSRARIEPEYIQFEPFDILSKKKLILFVPGRFRSSKDVLCLKLHRNTPMRLDLVM